jgi:sigma-B regulation protein RsbU (phosphoserine phosphatase)
MMIYKKLNKTIERITSKSYPSELDMLISVLGELQNEPMMNISGGRIWKLDPEKESYFLAYQTGKMEHLKKRFTLTVKDYPVFESLLTERTVFADETNKQLMKIGIFRYAATGVGPKISLGEKRYFEYLLAVNTPKLTDDLKYLLNIISAVLTSKIKQKRYHTSEQSIKADIDKARELQKSILPQHEYFFFDYELYGLSIPAEIIGGDFFDYVQLGEDHDRVGVALGDAASKGISAAAEALYISGALRMASTFEIKIVPFMKRLNRLVSRVFGDDKFSSLFYGEISNDMQGMFIYANAGHNPPLFIKRKTGEITYLQPTGPVLGPTPKAKYTLGNIYFEPGDVLLIYSDGLVEAANAEYEMYGEEALEESLRRHHLLTSKEIALRIIDEIQKFNANGAYSDDKTIVVIKKKMVEPA